MYTGAGPGPMLAAAAAWDELAAELRFHGGLLRVGGRRSDQRRVAGPVVDFDGGRGRTVCGVDERHSGAG